MIRSSRSLFQTKKNKQDSLMLSMKCKLQAGIPFQWKFEFSKADEIMVSIVRISLIGFQLDLSKAFKGEIQHDNTKL